MLASTTKATFTTFAGIKIIDYMKLRLHHWHNHKLCDAFHRIKLKCSIATVPARHH